MSNRRAILSIVPDTRQERFLARVLPSWQRYATRYQLPIILVRRSVTDGRHPYWDRWLTIQDGTPELAGVDELLLLDNDIFISDDAPNIFDNWEPSGVGVVEESAQGPWDPTTIPGYYRTFHVRPDDRVPNPTKVFNFGVCVLNRRDGHLFQTLYEKWHAEIRPRFSSAELRQRGVFFRVEADGPFLSYELQACGKIRPLPNKYNFFLPAWLEQTKIARLPFLLQSKAVQKLNGKVPAALLNSLAVPARKAMEDAVAQCYFLHVAGSKSPLWLFPE